MTQTAVAPITIGSDTLSTRQTASELGVTHPTISEAVKQINGSREEAHHIGIKQGPGKPTLYTPTERKTIAEHLNIVVATDGAIVVTAPTDLATQEPTPPQGNDSPGDQNMDSPSGQMAPYTAASIVDFTTVASFEIPDFVPEANITALSSQTTDLQRIHAQTGAYLKQIVTADLRVQLGNALQQNRNLVQGIQAAAITEVTQEISEAMRGEKTEASKKEQAPATA